MKCFRLASLIILFVLSLGCATLTPAQKAATACMAADLATTAVAFERGHEDLNPLYQGASWQAVVTGALLHWAWLEFVDSPRADQVYSVSHCGAAAWNLKVLSD